MLSDRFLPMVRAGIHDRQREWHRNTWIRTPLAAGRKNVNAEQSSHPAATGNPFVQTAAGTGDGSANVATRRHLGREKVNDSESIS